MSDPADFVLAYCRASGGIVEPPAYGVYDVLLPERVAQQLGVAAFQRLAFESDAPEAATHLGYNHPLVEQMIEAARATPACARFYIDNVRLDKRGLAELAAKSFSLSNARLQAVPGATEARALFHYLQVNFKAALVTDEKHEQLVSVWLDVQSGAAVEDMALATPSPDAAAWLDSLPVAPLAWLPGHDPLSREALAGLLDRAAQAAATPLAEPIARLQARSARFLELDRVRLEQYFDDIEQDLVRRQAKATDAGRLAALEAKLAAVRADRAAKLDDAAAKYRLRLELEPINAALIAQPKVQLPVQISNRHGAVERVVVWDPRRHVLQPLLCDACLRPTTALTLCAGGHLVCTDPACRAPQCADCTRFYCRLCAAELTACVVCDRPVCRRSEVLCPDCGRGTCRAHVRLCHAAGGEPRKIAEPAPMAESSRPAAAVAAPVTAPSEPAPALAGRGKGVGGSRQPAKKAHPVRKPAPVTRAAPVYSNLRLDVIIEPREPVVVAIVFKPRSRAEVAHRVWELVDDGIAVHCHCDKGPACAADQTLYRPAPVDEIETQLEFAINRLCNEYGIAPRHVTYALALGHGNVRHVPGLKLSGQWLNEAALSAARAAFDATYGRSARR